MPRSSAAERAAAFYRTDPASRVPPRALTARARTIWREIVAAKPIDWFDAGSLGLLADHCETQARLEACWVGLRQLPVGCKEAKLIMDEVRVLRANYGRSAQLLRLVVQHAIDWRSTKAAEKAPDAQGDALIGGQAAERFKVGA